MMQIHFAPLQGQTDYIYRQLHNTVAGGIDCYYTPFIRLEKNELRNKDLRDILQENNQGINVIPQIICNSREEFCRLCDLIQNQGWNYIDLNMGCPFPLQTHAQRGSGILPHPDIVADIIQEMQHRSEIKFSIKMRTGLTDTKESFELLPILNDAPIEHITLHPRLGIQQYKGIANKEVFKLFAERCKKPLIYNGDISTIEEIQNIEKMFPQLKGVMIGRGLLARPTLGWEYKNRKELSPKEQLSILLNIHDKLFAFVEQHYQGESQILSRMQSFWEYTSINKKSLKRLKKSGNLRNYREARIILERDNAN